MTDKEINETIARWIWPDSIFYYSQGELCYSPHEKETGITNDVILAVPDFTTSLDALFRYAVPKLVGDGIVEKNISFDFWNDGSVVCVLCLSGLKGHASSRIRTQNNGSPARALSLAIYKLVKGL